MAARQIVDFKTCNWTCSYCHGMNDTPHNKKRDRVSFTVVGLEDENIQLNSIALFREFKDILKHNKINLNPILSNGF